MYYIEIPDCDPLAKAIMEHTNSTRTLWLSLKFECEPSVFRMAVSSWSRHNDGKLGVDFESWEQYMERRAQVAGI